MASNSWTRPAVGADGWAASPDATELRGMLPAMESPGASMQLVLSSLVFGTVALAADQSARVARRLGQMLAAYYRGLEDGWLMYLRYETLARLSDHELARRGLARGDLGRAALDYAQQRQR